MNTGTSFCKITVTFKINSKRTAYIDATSMQYNPTPARPACPLTSRCPVGPRSHIHGSWFLLVHVNALSDSWPASHWCRNSVARRADVAPGRKLSVGPARKGHQCGRRRPSSTASDWTSASLAATWWSWPPRQSQKERAALRRGRRADNRKSDLTTHDGLMPRGRTHTSTPRCRLLWQHAPTSWMDTGRRSQWRSGEREKQETTNVFQLNWMIFSHTSGLALWMAKLFSQSAGHQSVHQFGPD